MRLTDLTLTDHLLPTGLCHLSLLTPAPLLYTGQEEIAYPASPQGPASFRRAELQGNYAGHPLLYGLVPYTRGR